MARGTEFGRWKEQVLVPWFWYSGNINKLFEVIFSFIYVNEYYGDDLVSEFAFISGILVPADKSAPALIVTGTNESQRYPLSCRWLSRDDDCLD